MPIYIFATYANIQLIKTDQAYLHNLSYTCQSSKLAIRCLGNPPCLWRSKKINMGTLASHSVHCVSCLSYRGIVYKGKNLIYIIDIWYTLYILYSHERINSAIHDPINHLPGFDVMFWYLILIYNDENGEKDSIFSVINTPIDQALSSWWTFYLRFQSIYRYITFPSHEPHNVPRHRHLASLPSNLLNTTKIKAQVLTTAKSSGAFYTNFWVSFKW